MFKFTMEVSTGQPLLILGCQRSGTSLLCSLLGAHSDINMLYESLSKDVFRLIGKKYNGNKLLAWRQIRMNKKASKWGHLINRLSNKAILASTFQKHRPFPIAHTSINDYLNKGAKIITITRDQNEVVKSITKRTPMNELEAIKEYKLCYAEIEKIKDQSYSISYNELVNNTESCLKGICDYLEIPYEVSMLDGVKYNAVYPNDKIVSNKLQ